MLSTSTAAGIVAGTSKGIATMANRKILITAACLIKGEHNELGTIVEFGEGATLSEAEGFTVLASSRGREIADDEVASLAQRSPRGRRSDPAA